MIDDTVAVRDAGTQDPPAALDPRAPDHSPPDPCASDPDDDSAAEQQAARIAADRAERLLAAAVEAVGGTPRPGQVTMARDVATAAGTGEHLLVQAGTGTGKSLAYLVPALIHAVDTHRPVVVSTATLALQAQIVTGDLPRIAGALTALLGRGPTWQLVKGRRNYLCRHKLSGGFPPEEDALFDLRPPAADSPATAVPTNAGQGAAGPAPAGPLGREVLRLREWAGQTETGDRDELVPGVGERAWRQVSVSANECLGSQRCPLAQDCFCEMARERAHEVDVVVTNHALVAIDSFENRSMLPEHDLLVVDEAHELSDRVTSVISGELTAGAVSAAVRRVRGAGIGGTDRLEDAGAMLAAALQEAPEGRCAAGLPEFLAVSVTVLRDTTRDLLTTLKHDPSTTGPDGARQQARAAVQELFALSDRLLAERVPDGPAGQEGQPDPSGQEGQAGQEEQERRDGGDGPLDLGEGSGSGGVTRAEQPPDVIWISRSHRSDGVERIGLNVAPLSVAGMLASNLFGTRTVVMTSATLALGGDFQATAAKVGLGREQAGSWRGADVGSPFDYPRQGILYLARHLPPPGRDGPPAALLEELAELIEAAGGRTLGLFSSRRAAEIAAAELRERLGVPVLCQGEDSTPTLVRQFARETRTCLFGTLSLWQGVDVPGPACQLVVIDRIPFPRPDDPLATARQQAVARAGGNGFMAVAAAHAALLLAQGAGRLVRTTGDRGVVAVLDPRLATARYGSYLRNCLPPFWATSDRDVVLQALRRIDDETE
ncbi:MAG: ATP-dependent helicase DinG [Actinomycetota bacterium]|nr:ATP-dependent helicase DinG [Actinomycetota bacterium]